MEQPFRYLRDKWLLNSLSGKLSMRNRLMVVWLAGGLGNQLFQFAFGRALAIKTGARVIFDPSVFLQATEPRRYHLDKLGLAPPLLRQTPRVNFDKGVVRIRRPLRYNIPRSPFKRTFRLFREKKDFSFDPSVFAQHEDCYLHGYWQSRRYFSDCNNEVIAAIRLPFSQLDEPGRTWLARIQNTLAVCVHVRRGDYLNSHTYSVHGLCDEPYYTAAMLLLRGRVPAAEFFVFSDDPAWCKAAFSGDNVHIVDVHSPDHGHLDLALMASCRHHIIANSSFSWWAAWLARHDAQIVVAPTPWTTRDGPAPELFPPEWIALDRATGAAPTAHVAQNWEAC